MQIAFLCRGSLEIFRILIQTEDAQNKYEEYRNF